MSSSVHATLPRRMYVPIESLEPRQLLSSQVNYGRWTIDATEAADQLIIQPKSGDPNTIQAILNGVADEQPREEIYSLTINLGAGNDSVIFKPGGPSRSKKMTQRGTQPNDRRTGNTTSGSIS